MSQREVWDTFYRSNGRAWRGNTRLPDPIGGEGDVLDVGCGSGKSTSTLIDMGYRVSGMDFSQEAVAICAERFPDIRFVVGDVLEIPFDGSSFDYVTAIHVLEHISDDDMGRASSELARVLRPDGYLFVRDFAPGDLRSGSREGSDIDYFHRTPEGIATLMPDFIIVTSEVVEERTRFGAVRRRSELLLRKRP